MFVAAEHVDEIGHDGKRSQIGVCRCAFDVGDGRVDQVQRVVAGGFEVAPDAVDGAGPVGGRADDRNGSRLAKDAIDIGQEAPPGRFVFIFAKRSESLLMRTISDAGGLFLPSR